MGEAELPPKIEIEYYLDKESVWKAPYFIQAGIEYAKKRKGEEAVTTQSEINRDFASIKIGRSVLERLSLAEIVQEAEKMRYGIDNSDAFLMNDIDVTGSFVGRRLSGTLPDPE
jgi:hypothetical protein